MQLAWLQEIVAEFDQMRERVTSWHRRLGLGMPRKALHPRNEELAMLLRIAMVPKRHLRGEALVYVIKVAQGRAAGTIRPGTVGHEELMEQCNLTLAELQETTGAKRHRLSLPVVSEDVPRMH